MVELQIPTSVFDQGKEFVNCKKTFLCDIDEFIKARKTIWNNLDKGLSSFMHVLKYVTGDVLIEDDTFYKEFINQLENSTEYLKSVTKTHRKLKAQIVDVLDGKTLVCDNPHCMTFFSNLINCNLVCIVNDKTKAVVDNKLKNNLHLYVNENRFDYTFKPTICTEKKYGEYLSKKLAENLTMSDLRDIYARKNKICVKGLKKEAIISKIED